MDQPLPILRKDLQLFPVSHEGRELLLVRDPFDLVPEGTAVPVDLYRTVYLLEGGTVRSLQEALVRQAGGRLVGTDEVLAILNRLDEVFLLESERLRAERDRVVSVFRSAPVRACSHAGQAYPENEDALKARLGEILSLGAGARAGSGRVHALVAPHIDLSVGARGYASAYGALKETGASRVVVLGVGHQMGPRLFCLSAKDYQTPLGLIRCDREAVGGLTQSGGDALAPDDFAHKGEHSIEFQSLFLAHLLGVESFSLVPVLCGNAQAGLPEYSRAAFLDLAGPFLDVLSRIAGEDGTLLVAGVDFSHTGPKFGHQETARGMERESSEHDRILLECLVRCDAEGFWEESARVQDRYNVCGFSALASLLEVLPSCRGEVLSYDVWHEAPTDSAVSFASAVFRDVPGAP